MHAIFFIKGLIIGFSIAAPVGPIGLLCIQRTLLKGRMSGLVSGFGAASADAIYGLIAGFGLTVISSFLISQGTYLRLIGGIFLCYLGIKTFLSKPAEEVTIINTTKAHGLIKDYASTLFLTLTNPITVLSFAAIFTGLGIVSTQGNYTLATILVIGVFLGSAIWWYLLTIGSSIFRSKFNSSHLGWINKSSGIIITGFGIISLVEVIF